MKAFLVFIGLLVTLTFSQRAYSLEGTYLFRDIEIPIFHLEDIEKVIVLSTPRTGSTLVYMIFQYLFEEKIAPRGSFDKNVVKSHDMKECDLYLNDHPNTYVVIPIRNPMDSFLSKIKILSSLNLLPPNENFIEKLLHSHIKEYSNLWEFIQKYRYKKLLLVYFETFHSDLDSLLSGIEKEFQITLSEQEKMKINVLFSKESISEISKQFPNFARQDPITGLHGNHIQNDNTQLKDYISNELLEKIQDQLHEVMSLYNYN